MENKLTREEKDKFLKSVLPNLPDTDKCSAIQCLKLQRANLAMSLGRGKIWRPKTEEQIASEIRNHMIEKKDFSAESIAKVVTKLIKENFK